MWRTLETRGIFCTSKFLELDTVYSLTENVCTCVEETDMMENPPEGTNGFTAHHGKCWEFTW